MTEHIHRSCFGFVRPSAGDPGCKLSGPRLFRVVWPQVGRSRPAVSGADM